MNQNINEEFTTEQKIKMLISDTNYPGRFEDETQEDYKKRRSFSQKLNKAYLKGKVTWDPYLLGEKGRSKGMVSTVTNREFIDNVKSRMIDRINKSKEELAMPVEVEEVNDGK